MNIKDIKEVLLGHLPVGLMGRVEEIDTVVLPLCYGDPRDRSDGCHARLNAGVYGLDLRSGKIMIIQTGGNKERIPLADIMRQILEDKKSYCSDYFFGKSLGWGTESEISKAFLIIDSLGLNINNTKFRVIISSNKEHLPRIKYYVGIYNFKDVKVEYRESVNNFGLFNTIREKLGLLFIKFKNFILKDLMLENKIEDFERVIYEIRAQRELKK